MVKRSAARLAALVVMGALDARAAFAQPLPDPDPAPVPPRKPAPVYPIYTETALGYAPPKKEAPIPVVDIQTHQHDGAGVRVWAGPSFTRARVEGDVRNSTFLGGGYALGAGFGGVVVPNCLVTGEVYMNQIVRPSARVDGPADEPGFDAMWMIGLGPAVSYYFMPHNVYVGGALLWSRLVVNYDRQLPWPTRTSYGFDARLFVGKEWWASKNWGVGGALQFHAAAIADRTSFRDIQHWRVYGTTFVFSATYN